MTQYRDVREYLQELDRRGLLPTVSRTPNTDTEVLPLVRWPDLDSHLNLVDDPFAGPERHGDVLRPAQRAGVGAQRLQEVA